MRRVMLLLFLSVLLWPHMARAAQNSVYTSIESTEYDLTIAGFLYSQKLYQVEFYPRFALPASVHGESMEVAALLRVDLGHLKQCSSNRTCAVLVLASRNAERMWKGLDGRTPESLRRSESAHALFSWQLASAETDVPLAHPPGHDGFAQS